MRALREDETDVPMHDHDDDLLDPEMDAPEATGLEKAIDRELNIPSPPVPPSPPAGGPLDR